jgi:hypothetical protein
MPGECWAFEGTSDDVIQLTGNIKTTAVSTGHASHALLPIAAIKSAPKDFSIWRLKSLHDGQYPGFFSYDINGSPLQYFTIQESSESPFGLMELQIHTNHSNPTYTCLLSLQSTWTYGASWTCINTVKLKVNNTVMYKSFMSMVWNPFHYLLLYVIPCFPFTMRPSPSSTCSCM